VAPSTNRPSSETRWRTAHAMSMGRTTSCYLSSEKGEQHGGCSVVVLGTRADQGIPSRSIASPSSLHSEAD
jgi:hypothetical protein